MLKRLHVDNYKCLEAFLRRFFTSMGWKGRQLRVKRSPLAKGSAEQFVREEFPKEIEAYRRNRNRVGCELVAMSKLSVKNEPLVAALAWKTGRRLHVLPSDRTQRGKGGG